MPKNQHFCRRGSSEHWNAEKQFEISSIDEQIDWSSTSDMDIEKMFVFAEQKNVHFALIGTSGEGTDNI